MAEGILGLGSSGSNGLSQELIDKLKAAESKGTVDVITKRLETWDTEFEKITTIEVKVQELLSSMQKFDLNNTGTNIFEQINATTTGSSANFNAIDATGIQEGTTTVDITQLAQRDVYQTDTFADPEAQVLNGNDVGDKISINIAGTTYDFSTEGKTYTQLADDINANSLLNASVEEVGSGSFRLIIKSKDTGLSNALTISETGINLGYTNTLSAQNLNAAIDGVSYDVSSNNITIQGNLTMNAIELGTSTITVEKDNSTIMPGIKDFTNKYNELVDLIDAELYATDSPINDLSSLRLIMSNIKDKIFGSYGENSDLSLFNYGFGIDKQGHINIDEEVLSSAITDNILDIKSLFIGDATNPGLGTQLNSYLDDLDSYDGTLTLYDQSLAKRKITYEEEKIKAQETLDNKYSFMSEQFASYTAIITQMQAAFGGMKMMIEQSTASK